jgi:hypothetical protein
VKRWASVLMILVFSAGCGGEKTSPEAEPSRQTEAGIELRHPVEISRLLAWARAHGIRPAELNVDYELQTETIASGHIVQPGMTDAQIARAYKDDSVATLDEVASVMKNDPGITAEQRANVAEAKRRAASGPALVDSLTARGTADALHALEDDPLVESVFVRP